MIEQHKLNPDLFKDEPLPELKGETYYAYLESVEQIDSIIHLKFDCLNANKANNTQINKESILQFPSIKIEISGNKEVIRAKMNYTVLYLLESSWMLITTKIQQSNLTVNQYFNFQTLNIDNVGGLYDIESVTLFRDLTAEFKAKVKEIISATTIEESPEEEVRSFFDELELDGFDHVNVYNVGQGNCTALVTVLNNPLLYFDVGGGSNGCIRTYPAGFRVCHTDLKPVILSHWDDDHIISAYFDPNLLHHKWLAPVQGNLSNTAMHIAQFLINNGRLIRWNHNIPYIDFSGNRIIKCNGSTRYKNSSGLALYVQYQPGDYVILPGDATYTKIPNKPTGNFIGLVASHHGSRGSMHGMPTATLPGMIAYSAGNQTRPLHPHPVAVRSYTRHGWNNSRLTINGSIKMRKNRGRMSVPCKNKCTLAPIQHY